MRAQLHDGWAVGDADAALRMCVRARVRVRVRVVRARAGRYTTSVLRATLTPPEAPSDEFRALMETLSDRSCAVYRRCGECESPRF